MRRMLGGSTGVLDRVRTAVRRRRPPPPPAAFPGTSQYWEQRYAEGGTSGAGSTGELARFKADVLNDFVDRHGVRTVTELGCGDGQQLSLARYPEYRGLDVSATAVDMCARRFAGDHTKSFYRYDPRAFHDRAGLFRSDLALSLDVVFHLVDDGDFDRYMRLLFACGTSFVCVYSSNKAEDDPYDHVRHRAFADWVERECGGWRLLERVENPLRGRDPAAVSDFFFYTPDRR
ncbi:MAG: class I SAM-dependent methyltransferase [Actinomycetes bacterium]